ncbi:MULTISPECIES: YheC/YheD family endospore coat-associated protein [unclassified Cytobacillus]|uniref:YheC/YheD family endospore coat-associated protein n=1 Tax=unclassified Cytobacillus TaxID=2675268 RepID=UPI002040C229|nr:YheC/YheD family protein [Cytobacillus sp. AMY 15.2]MCM3092448.1 YheC/YheD family protein [Cytobacillus sp. AMY 15.2]
MRKQYQIEISDSASKTVYIPNELNLHTHLTRLAFGTHSADASFILQKTKKNSILISKDVAEALHFPDLKIPLHAFANKGILYLGPLVGIFTSGFTSFPLRPVGDRTLFFAKLLSVKKTVGAIPFLFGDQQINWEKETINGLFYHEEGWETFEVPFPNVVYDRLPNRRSERRNELKEVRGRMQKDYLIPWYNPGFFNKLDVYERLQNDDDSSYYLPETHPFSSFSVIERMLADYGHVYLKPINGSLGLGIHQIIFDKKDGYYYCRYRVRDENRLRRFNTLENLMRNVFAGRNLNRMLVQQGIHLLRQEQRAVDFRVHTNKDENGEWKVTAAAAKIAGPGSVTTHVKSGGEIKTLDEVFESDAEKTEAVAKLSEAALTISKALERNMEGIIGEIGFDFGLDRNGHVWLFEANSKPGRSIFKHPQLREFDFLTRKLSLSFAVFLAEASIMKPQEIVR